MAVLGVTSQIVPELASLQTYLGQGDGTFSPPVVSPATSSKVGNFPLVGDVNHDGNLDLIGAGVLALGAGDGTFPRMITLSECLPPSTALGTRPYAIGGPDFTIADFRRDGNLDLVLLSILATGGAIPNIYAAASICFGSGNETFVSGPAIYSGGGQLITSGDFNGDGKPDALIVSEGQGELSYSTVFGHGDGTFEKQLDTPWSDFVALSSKPLPKPAVSDMNGDGKSDLVQIAGSLGAVVLLSNGDGMYAQAASISPGEDFLSVAVADFNNDGLPDIIATTGNATFVSTNTSLHIDSILNAALPGNNEPVAPGSLVTIFGIGIGPSVGVSSTGAPLPNSTAGVSVTFNGIPAPLLYVSSRQINAQVPWNVSGDARVVVTTKVSTTQFNIATAPIAPAIFENGGQAFAFNSDGTIACPSGSIVGVPSHPALAGDTLTVLANGLGPVAPAIADGAVSSDATRTTGPTPVFIGGIACEVPFAGLSASAVGVSELKVVVPPGVHGTVPLQINAGGFITPADITITIQ